MTAEVSLFCRGIFLSFLCLLGHERQATATVLRSYPCFRFFQSVDNLSEDLTVTRLGLAARHQNVLRASKGLPLIEIDGPASIGLGRHRTGMSFGEYPVPGPKVGFDGVAINFMVLISGDRVFRIQWGDVHGLNHVYLYRDRTLVDVEPFLHFVLSADSNPDVVIFRNMGQREYDFWKTGKTNLLRENGQTWGYSASVIHGQFGFPSSVGEKRERTMRWTIPKKVLREWYDTGNIRTGIINFYEERTASGTIMAPEIEIVFFEPVWEELAHY